MALMPVAEAKARILEAAKPLPAETVALESAQGRVLAKDVAATRNQPPFPASAMDGYAVRAADVADVPARLQVIGASIAGKRYAGKVGPGKAVRIFTGAPVPEGADTIVIQEDADRDGDTVVVRERMAVNRHIRPAGLDFRKGETVLTQGMVLNARLLGLAAAMNREGLPVRRKPVVAILSTGDELVRPGDKPGPDQIIASSAPALAAFARRFGAEPLMLGIVPDRKAVIARAIEKGRKADILLTTGGASVGEHDLVQEALAAAGVKLDFWKIAMRPGKPLMFARRGQQRILGLPGNPVSSLVCARIFVKPLIDRLLGLPVDDGLVPAVLDAPLAANDQREDYLRATFVATKEGLPRVTAHGKQDSSMQRTLAFSDCLIVRAPFAPAAAAGERVEVLPLDF
ncbi:MAG: gephyrin-like molybdotransferase Glp [Hyphomicrobiales bacterium]